MLDFISIQAKKAGHSTIYLDTKEEENIRYYLKRQWGYAGEGEYRNEKVLIMRKFL